MHRINLPTAANLEGRIDVAAALGSGGTAMFVYDLDPGTSSSPYHYEYAEEWLLVVAGSVVVRAPDGEHTLETGDLVRFPPGADGAHKVSNREAEAARIVFFSSARVPAVSVYPDSDKIGVWPGEDGDSLLFERKTNVPWSHGEEGWQKA
jgi:uncharacterized cupin superfamily protein